VLPRANVEPDPRLPFPRVFERLFGEEENLPPPEKKSKKKKRKTLFERIF
jgi:hypothetical protein